MAPAAFTELSPMSPFQMTSCRSWPQPLPGWSTRSTVNLVSEWLSSTVALKEALQPVSYPPKDTADDHKATNHSAIQAAGGEGGTRFPDCTCRLCGIGETLKPMSDSPMTFLAPRPAFSDIPTWMTTGGRSISCRCCPQPLPQFDAKFLTRSCGRAQCADEQYVCA